MPLPTVLTQLTPGPPFGAPATGGENEGGALRFPIASTQTISVRVDGRGAPFAVRVRQRLELLRAGDYSFAIGAPVEDVRAAPGSESEPGLREGAILWQGFSPRRKVLAADLVLRARDARANLPLRIAIERRGAKWRIRLVNATALPYQAFTGDARVSDAAAALDEVRQRGGKPSAGGIILNLRGRATAQRVTIAAPLRITGKVGFRDGDTVAVDALLGDGDPLAHEVVLQGRGTPQLKLEVTPSPPERMLRPPAGATWRAYVRRREDVDARALVSRAVLAELAWARTRQYQTFVADPDPYGPRSATYLYVTAPRPVTAARQRRGGGGGFPVALLAIPLAAAAAGALVVLWAHG